jgi:hypothetical protein
MSLEFQDVKCFFFSLNSFYILSLQCVVQSLNYATPTLHIEGMSNVRHVSVGLAGNAQ